jgi:hypothetical protein
MSAAPALAQPAPVRVYTPDEIKLYMEVPFRSADLAWRVLNKNGGEARVCPYARRPAYMKRLDTLFGSGGWGQTFSVTTVSNIQREKYVNGKSVLITTGKVLVTSTISIKGLGTKSSTGEGWADDENGSTRAEAQAFRRACAEFGLGRYLRDLDNWVCKVPLNKKGFPEYPHFSVLPDFAIHPSELEAAQQFRSKSSNHYPQQHQRSAPATQSTRTQQQPIRNSNSTSRPAAATRQPAAATAAKPTPISGRAPQTQGNHPKPDAALLEAKLAILRTPEVKSRLSSYLEQLSQSLILSVVNGVSELHALGQMKGNLVNDVFCNLDRAVSLVNQIEDREPVLPNNNTLPSILQKYSAKSLSELQSLGDLKAVFGQVETLYRAERERQYGRAA